MTDNNALKKLVRTRMAEHGESYTTAHRIVTSRKTASTPRGVVPGYPGFGFAQHHPSAKAAHLLGHAGIAVSEAMACGLGGGIGFLYAVFDYKTVDHPLLTIVAQHHPRPWLEAIAAHTGFEFGTVTSSSPKAALGKLDAVLGDGRPAQLVVGRGHLPWHDDVSPEEAADPYPIVVAGRANGTYLIDDVDSNPHALDAQQLGTAWAAHRKGRLAITTVVPPTGSIDGNAIRAALRTTAGHLTGPVLGNTFDINMGLSGMERFANDLRDRTTKAGWATRFAKPAGFAIGMSRLADCLTWAHTGPGGTRTLYAEFLDEAGITPSAGLAGRSGQAWTALADTAAAYDGSDQVVFLDRLADLADACLGLERELAASLAEAAGTDVA